MAAVTTVRLAVRLCSKDKFVEQPPIVQLQGYISEIMYIALYVFNYIAVIVRGTDTLSPGYTPKQSYTIASLTMYCATVVVGAILPCIVWQVADQAPLAEFVVWFIHNLMGACAMAAMLVSV